MPCKVARPELSLAISPVSTRKRGIRRASSVEAEAAEFFLWTERHARRGRPPHQRDFVRRQPVRGVDEVGDSPLVL